MGSLFPETPVEVRCKVDRRDFTSLKFNGADATAYVGSFAITINIFRSDARLLCYKASIKSASGVTLSGELSVKVAFHDREGETHWQEDVFCVCKNEVRDEHQFVFHGNTFCDTLHHMRRAGFLKENHIHFSVNLSDLECDDCNQPLRDDLQQMWTDMLFPDMHLISRDGEKISCHRAVLCSASSVFKAMLTGEFKEASHAEIDMHDATGVDIRAFLECVYTGYVPDALDQEALGRILYLVDMYDIADLAEACACKLVLHTDKSNVAETVSALLPYTSTGGHLAKWSEFLLNLLQGDKELLVSLLSKGSQTPARNRDLQDPSSGTRQKAYCSPGPYEEVARVDSEMCALPLLKPESHQHAEIKVIQFPVPPPGLDLCSLAPAVFSSQPLRISVLCFNKCTSDFSDTLRTSELAHAMLSNNVQIEPLWANGAKVFVENLCPEMLEPVMKLDSLRPWHVIVNSENETDVIESINSAWSTTCFKSKRPRVRQGYTQHLTLEQSNDTQACVDSSCPVPEVILDRVLSCEHSSVMSESDALPVSCDVAGTVHYSLSPRSFV